MSRALLRIRVTMALAAVAIFVAGCADSRMAANDPSQGEQPYKTSYGLTSDGPTTDVYTELFGPRKTAAAPTTAAATQQVQPVAAPAAIQPVQPATASAPARLGQGATATASTRQTKPASASAAQPQVQPAPAPAQVAQQPAAPQAPPEPDVPTMYGITANGPTTDLFTEIFGPRRRDGQ